MEKKWQLGEVMPHFCAQKVKTPPRPKAVTQDQRKEGKRRKKRGRIKKRRKVFGQEKGGG